jgi:hypothetical protein
VFQTLAPPKKEKEKNSPTNFWRDHFYIYAFFVVVVFGDGGVCTLIELF